MSLAAAALLSSFGAHADVPSYEQAFSPGQGATALVIKTIRSATNSIGLAAYSFTSLPIARALVEARYRGVKVEIVSDAAPHAISPAVRSILDGARIEIRSCPQYAAMHNKFMIVDEKTLETGSFNYTFKAERENAENVLVIRNAPPPVVQQFLAQWQMLWTSCALRPTGMPTGIKPSATIALDPN